VNAEIPAATGGRSGFPGRNTIVFWDFVALTNCVQDLTAHLSSALSQALNIMLKFRLTGAASVNCIVKTGFALFKRSLEKTVSLKSAGFILVTPNALLTTVSVPVLTAVKRL
jgi:hypothetical protein